MRHGSASTMSCSYQGTEGDVIGYRRGKAPSLGRTERGMEGMGGTREMIRAYTKSQTSCSRVLHNRLWRFPFKPPALLGVIGSPAKPPALPERIEAVVRLRDQSNRQRRHTISLG